ncbi:MAG: apolipoprotein N-acyltransferase [Candidatus Acidoferrales bacterium]
MGFLSALLRRPLVCALLTGALLILSFPRPHLYLLAWVALAPLLAVSLPRRSRRRVFAYGYLAGVVFFGGTCYWVYGVMRIYGRLSVGAAGAVLVLFVLILALQFGLFSLMVREVAQRWPLAALMVSPCFWVALEWLRTYVPFGGFPWNLLGYALAPQVGWIQPAAYTGIYGVSFLVVGVNALVAACWIAPAWRRLTLLAAVAVILAGTAFWGHRWPPVAATRQAVLVQTNLPQLEEFDPHWVDRHPDEMARLEQLTREGARRQKAGPPDLIIWPEIPVSLYFRQDPRLRARLLQLTQATGSHFLVGIVDFQPGEGAEQHPTNSAVLLSPQGGFVGQYDKLHLVPFGEYVPLGRWLGWLGALTQEVSDFVPGSDQQVLPAGAQRLGVLICYEAIFPGLTRSYIEGGADVLVNISNDGWFGRSAAPAQHLNMARVRAVEARRFLLRATNTGITAVVDPLGRIVARAPSHQRTVLVAGYAPRREVTFYARHGDWFAALCALLGLAALARKFWMEATEVTGNGDDRGTGTTV